MLTYVHEITEDMLDAQKELNDRFCRAMSSKDVDGAMTCFSSHPDLILVLWGNVIRGPESLRAALGEFFGGYAAVRLEVNKCDYVAAGDGIIAVGTATYYLRDAAGTETRMVERWTDLRRRIDGRWVYVLDHATEVRE